MDDLRKLQELAESAVEYGEKFYDDGVKKYSTETRNVLSEMSKLCKSCRADIQTTRSEMPVKAVSKGSSEASATKGKAVTGGAKAKASASGKAKASASASAKAKGSASAPKGKAVKGKASKGGAKKVASPPEPEPEPEVEVEGESDEELVSDEPSEE